MNNPVKDFITNSRGLTRNPLGIIALFVSLIYGFACLVLSTSINNLTGPCERLPLVWFIIIFPLIILGVFKFLVVKHHEKLYGPGDYKDERLFTKTFNKANINKKIKTEFKNFDSTKKSEDTYGIGDPITNDNNEDTEFEQFLNSYLAIQSLAVDYIESKFNESITRNIRFKDFPDYPFDGVIEKSNKIIGLEIKYLKTIDSSKGTFDNLIGVANKFATVYRNSDRSRKFILLIFIITEATLNSQMVSQLIDLENTLRISFKEIDIIIEKMDAKTLYDLSKNAD